MLPRQVLEVNVVYLKAIRNGVFETGGQGFERLRSKREKWSGPAPTGSGYSGRTVANQDDFLEIRDENAFIEILRSASIITKDIKKILDEKLGFRNTCAHPNDIVVPESKVLATIEDLVYNVVLKYPL